jgi:hypothetical protein
VRRILPTQVVMTRKEKKVGPIEVGLMRNPSERINQYGKYSNRMNLEQLSNTKK